MSNVVNVYHKSRDVVYELNFQANGETTWPFVAEGDGEIYDVELNNVSSYEINGNTISLPFSITDSNSYTVSISKTNENQSAYIKFYTRRAVHKTIIKNVPDYTFGNGRYLYVISNQILYEFDTTLLTASNYAGSGAWSTSPISNTYTMPDISAELDRNGVAGNIIWRSLCFVYIDGTPYMFCLADSYPTWTFIVSFFNLNDKKFYQNDLITEGYSRIYSAYAANSRIGALIYNYIDQNILIQSTRGNGSGCLLYDINTGDVTTYSLGGVVDSIINYRNAIAANYKMRLSFDPVNNEFIGQNMRLSLPSESNRNLMGTDGIDSEYIKSTGECAFIFYNNNVIDFYNETGKLSRRAAIGSVDGATGGGFIIHDSENSNNYICYAPRDRSLIRLIDIDGSNGYAGDLSSVTSDHNGFRGVMKSSFSGLIFMWGRVGTDSGKRMYVVDPSMRDATCEIGYYDFTEEIDDMFSNQIL